MSTNLLIINLDLDLDLDLERQYWAGNSLEQHPQEDPTVVTNVYIKQHSVIYGTSTILSFKLDFEV